MKAYLKNYRQSPRKVRLVGDFAKGKDVARALVELSFLPKRASDAIRKLILSAVANAKNNYNVPSDTLYVKNITVDQGVTLKRFRARARGRASRINKRTSNVSVVLAQRDVDQAPAAKKSLPETTKEAPASAEK